MTLKGESFLSFLSPSLCSHQTSSQIWSYSQASLQYQSECNLLGDKLALFNPYNRILHSGTPGDSKMCVHLGEMFYCPQL